MHIEDHPHFLLRFWKRVCLSLRKMGKSRQKDSPSSPVIRVLVEQTQHNPVATAYGQEALSKEALHRALLSIDHTTAVRQ